MSCSDRTRGWRNLARSTLQTVLARAYAPTAPVPTGQTEWPDEAIDRALAAWAGPTKGRNPREIMRDALIAAASPPPIRSKVKRAVTHRDLVRAIRASNREMGKEEKIRAALESFVNGG